MEVIFLLKNPPKNVFESQSLIFKWFYRIRKVLVNGDVYFEGRTNYNREKNKLEEKIEKILKVCCCDLHTRNDLLREMIIIMEKDVFQINIHKYNLGIMDFIKNKEHPSFLVKWIVTNTSKETYPFHFKLLK